MPSRLRTLGHDAWRLIAHSLSGRILLLTMLFVMASVALIYVPSMARYHHQLLVDRVRSAELAILPFAETPEGQFSAQLRTEMLSRAGVGAVILNRGGQRRFFLIDDQPPPIQATYDIRDESLLDETSDLLRCITAPSGRTIRIISATQLDRSENIQVIAAEDAIRAALSSLSWRALTLALFISALTSALVFASLYIALVRPMKRITGAMIAFRANPEDAEHIFRPSARMDEIGVAERELAAMQRDLYGNLRQKARLATLGAAVSKIQHDLRNILASAQMASDRLAAVEDPAVKSLTARIVAALDRAVTLATSTLRFGKPEEQPPSRKRLALAPLVDEAGVAVMPDGSAIVFVNAVPQDLEIDADPEQLFRVLLNLARNAREALDAMPGRGNGGTGRGCIRIEARRADGAVIVDVADDGPGIPEMVRERLFLPFASGARPGGSGLGLAIARELIRAHGGDVVLVHSGPEGTCFRIAVPDRMAG